MKYFVTFLLFMFVAVGIAVAESEPGGTEAPSTEGVEVEAPDAKDAIPTPEETVDMGVKEGKEAVEAKM